jgi:hypothetical protein
MRFSILIFIITFLIACSNSTTDESKHPIDKMDDTKPLVQNKVVDSLKSNINNSIDSNLLKFAQYLNTKGYVFTDPYPNPNQERDLDTLLLDKEKKILIYRFNSSNKLKEYFDTSQFLSYRANPRNIKERMPTFRFIRQLTKAVFVSGISYHKSTMYVDAWQFKSFEEAFKAKQMHDALDWLEIFPKTYSTAIVSGKALYVFHAFTYGPSLNCKKHSEWMEENVIGGKGI